MTFTPIMQCRSCGERELIQVLDLGNQPLANSYRHPDDAAPEPRYPLAVVRCAACSLVQLDGTVRPEVMFDNYHYFSSYSTTMVESMRQLAVRMTRERELDADDLVLEIASNDGYLLKHYVELGVPVLGVEPARNVAAVAVENGVPTLAEYFSSALAEQLQSSSRGASVVHANNVMAHVPDINDFVAGIAAVLRKGGVAVVETPYVMRLVQERQFDTIYHEHVFYYSLTAIDALTRRHGLVVSDIEQIGIHGGSLRLFLEHSGGAQSSRVGELLSAEADAGINDSRFYSDFADRVAELKSELTDLIAQLRSDGATVAAYGAAAKGTVLLNHFGLDHRQIDFVADRSEHKRGLLMPGTSIPIVSSDELVVRRPDYTLLLAWNFADEIVGQQQGYHDAGGRFVVPVPSVSIR